MPVVKVHIEIGRGEIEIKDQDWLLANSFFAFGKPIKTQAVLVVDP